MIADFAIHDKGDGNPHAHILLTLRAMDAHGKCCLLYTSPVPDDAAVSTDNIQHLTELIRQMKPMYRDPLRLLAKIGRAHV